MRYETFDVCVCVCVCVCMCIGGEKERRGGGGKRWKDNIIRRCARRRDEQRWAG